jgi:MoxR-like ATPase
LDYPSKEEELQIVRMTTTEYDPSVNKILSGRQILEFQSLIRRVPVSDNVMEYAVNIVRSTRPNENNSDYVRKYISYGAGPRASQYLIRGAKSRAAIQGRFSPEIEDIKAVAIPVLRHRIVCNFNAEAENISPTEIINTVVSNVK